MGRLKMLLPLRNTTVIRRAIQNLIDARVDEIIVVLGHSADEVRAHIRDLPVRIVLNRRHRQGMLTSIWAGLRAIDERTSLILLALADQPFVEPGIIKKIISTFRKSAASIVLPEFQGRTGHPIALDPALRPGIFKLDIKKGLRELTHSPAAPSYRLRVNSQAVRFDIDTPEDYELALERMDAGDPARKTPRRLQAAARIATASRARKKNSRA